MDKTSNTRRIPPPRVIQTGGQGPTSTRSYAPTDPLKASSTTTAGSYDPRYTGAAPGRPSQSVAPRGSKATAPELSPSRDSQSMYPTPQLPTQTFDYFLVINFQATCDVHTRSQPEPRVTIYI